MLASTRVVQRILLLQRWCDQSASRVGPCDKLLSLQGRCHEMLPLQRAVLTALLVGVQMNPAIFVQVIKYPT